MCFVKNLFLAFICCFLFSVFSYVVCWGVQCDNDKAKKISCSSEQKDFCPFSQSGSSCTSHFDRTEPEKLPLDTEEQTGEEAVMLTATQENEKKYCFTQYDCKDYIAFCARNDSTKDEKRQARWYETIECYYAIPRHNLLVFGNMRTQSYQQGDLNFSRAGTF